MKRKYKTKQDKENEHNWNELISRHPSRPFGTDDSGVQRKVSGIPRYSDIGRGRGLSSTTLGMGDSGVRICERTHKGSVTGPSVERPRYEGEMLEREQEALKEIEKKKKRVGILCNKSAYQYITDETDLTTLGKK